MTTRIFDTSCLDFTAANNAGGDIAQLAELYGVRVREIARLQEQSSAREERWRQQYQRLEQRLLQVEAEKKTAQTSSEQAQSLLGESLARAIQ